MCGIVGIVAPDDRHPAPASAVRRMAEAVRHRGPDADGFHEAGGVHLGMRRLSVIDLETGDQPIYNEDGSIAVVYNGEIYNFAALRAELVEKGHEFQTRSDTEVIAHLFEEEGLEAFGRLNGMFAIAIHDQKNRRVVLARDPHGMKPLYWTQDSSGLRFASELKAIFADATVSRAPDFAALLDYLVHWYVPTPRSAFVGLSKLRPSHLLVVGEDGGVEERPYARQQAAGELAVDSLEDAATATLSALEDAVERQLVADVPVGLFLSGGLDSALVAAVAARVARKRLRAFTVSFDQHASYDEAPVAAAVARALDLEHVVIPFPQDPSELVRKTLATFDEPFGDYSGVAMTRLCTEARAFATVCLAGDGGDEMFAGYTHYRAPAYAKLFKLLPASLRPYARRLVERLPTSFDRISFDYKAKRFVRGAPWPALEAHLLYKAVFFGEERRSLVGPRLANLADRHPMAGLTSTLERLGREDTPLLSKLMKLDRETFMLDDDLVKVDRTSMAASLEVRLPMLDHVVVDTADQIPARLMMRPGQTKAVLRAVARRVLPRRVARLKKKGFTPPMPHWLAGPLAALTDDLLEPRKVERAGLVRSESVRALLAEHRSQKRDRCRELWALLSLHDWWYRQGF